MGSRKANCLTFEKQSCGSIFSLKWNRQNAPVCNYQDSMDKNNKEYIQQLSTQLDSINFNTFKEAILGYIAGFIVQKISKSLSCHLCSQSLLFNQISLPVIHDHYYTNLALPKSLMLINSKNCGGLALPFPSVINIISKAEKLFQIHISKMSKINQKVIAHETLTCLEMQKLFPELHKHDLENEQLTEYLHSIQQK